MGTRFLRNFFEPNSVVVIGASEKNNSMGGLVIRSLQEGKFPGSLWTVNPRGYDAVFGVPCVKKVFDLPQAPDLAVVCSPMVTVPATIEQLGRLGVKAVLVLSGGSFLDESTSKEGSMRERMLAAARRSGIRVLGPECMGLIVPGRHLNATYSSQPVKTGKVAYLGQSGMLGNAMIDWAAGQGIGFSHLVTLGDSVDVMLPDLIDYINQNSPAQAILLHLERINDAQHFMTSLREASRNRLVLAIKSGRTPESDLSGLPPTPGVINRDSVYDAALARAGVVRVDNSDELFDALGTLSRMRPLRGDRLAIVANGLGPALLAIDRLITSGGKLAQFTIGTRQALLESDFDMSLPGSNPVDLGGNATPEKFVGALEIVAADANVDAVLVVHAPTRLAPSKATAQAVVANRKRFKRNLLTSWMGLEEALSARHECHLAGIPTYISPEKAVKAFIHMVDYQRVQTLLQETPPSLPFGITTDNRQKCHGLIAEAKASGRDRLSHQKTGEVLQAYGIPIALSRYVVSAEEAAAAFEELQAPLGLKAIHEQGCLPYHYPKYQRKPSSGLLQDLNSAGDVASGVERLQHEIKTQFPDSEIHCYCLQPMQRGKHSIQLSAGITRDPVFGPVIVFGIGGYRTNVMADRHVALPPLNMTLAGDLIANTHAGKLILDHSPDPQRDIDRLCQLLVKLSQMASDLLELRGLEINPLLLNRDGMIAVDFALDLGEPARHAIMPYPEELREWVTLKNDMRVEIRPVRGEDAPLITEFHSRLSEESIRFRYFHNKADLTKRDLALLAQINYDRQMAFIAEHTLEDGEKEMLGVVRVWNDPDNIRTEFSVIIRDDMQGVGLGSVLMKKMIGYCKSVGTLEMIGKIMVDNHPMRGLMKYLGFTSHYNMEEQVVDAVLRLNEPDNDWQRHRLEAQP
ncbi:GNAT family N-acetyltransferase [Halomonas sp. M20]|uniref:bifunctional acetate--CoA ligase family protein/GNAT family N-acetyltransferase n=1 Tax=Halomonas sp. M20 TaxID=2763264 RepID=UPI001D0AF489|nr:GNAT family N-acetyltransferase [Halomonas sp. M20]